MKKTDLLNQVARIESELNAFKGIYDVTEVKGRTLISINAKLDYQDLTKLTSLCVERDRLKLLFETQQAYELLNKSKNVNLAA